MEDSVLARIAHELYEQIRKGVTVDRKLKERARDRIMARVLRLLAQGRLSAGQAAGGPCGGGRGREPVLEAQASGAGVRGTSFGRGGITLPGGAGSRRVRRLSFGTRATRRGLRDSSAFFTR
ncbi:hypothetical protein ACFWVP_26285 [Streptomyces sp. NPDC058637]|uniref:hypothetical protein n=1 Tax=Streptomyces sp. NPDC058637 TaxID=3346569 RepID=UPI003663E24D